MVRDQSSKSEKQQKFKDFTYSDGFSQNSIRIVSTTGISTANSSKSEGQIQMERCNRARFEQSLVEESFMSNIGGNRTQASSEVHTAILTCAGQVRDLSVLADEDGHRIMGACPPERTTLLELIQAFVSYARSHADELSDNAALAVTRAFQEAFPCGANSPRFRRLSRRLSRGRRARRRQQIPVAPHFALRDRRRSHRRPAVIADPAGGRGFNSRMTGDRRAPTVSSR